MEGWMANQGKVVVAMEDPNTIVRDESQLTAMVGREAKLCACSILKIISINRTMIGKNV